MQAEHFNCFECGEHVKAAEERKVIRICGTSAGGKSEQQQIEAGVPLVIMPCPTDDPGCWLCDHG